MRIVIFGGTSEGRRLSERLAELGAALTVCVASDYGREEQGVIPGVSVRVGPLDAEEKRALLKDATLCVDATHPYARHISETVRAACEAAGVPLLRLKRDESETAGARVFADAAGAAAWLSRREGNVLLTTGAKELAAYAALRPERLFPRVLPCRESLAACEALGIPHRNIIAMQGPFSREMNIATIRQYRIRWLVSKDGGAVDALVYRLRRGRSFGCCSLALRC